MEKGITRSIKRPTYRSLLLFGLLGCFANVTVAETASERPIIEEIVVTATYRETSLMDTPQAISALGQDVIEEMGAQSMGDIYLQIPGLSMSGTQTGNNQFTVRGISSQTGNSQQNLTLATVGVYLDNTPVTSALGPARQISGNLFDIQRVEVLKGPQGTLFGEGSQGGTIRYLYNQPDLTEFDAAISLGGAQMSESDDYSHRIDAMINVPMSDQLAFRAVVFDTETAGFIDNTTPVQDDFNPEGATGGRAALLYAPTDWLDLTATAYFVDSETEGSSEVFRPFEIGLPAFPGQPPESKDELKLYNFLAEAEFEWGSFTSSTSYLDRESAYIQGQTAATIAAFDQFAAFTFFLADPTSPVPLDGQNLSAGVVDFTTASERFSQEFRLVSSADARLRWTTGLFYKKSTDDISALVLVAPNPGREQFVDQIAGFFLTPVNTHSDKLKELAGFGEVSYDLTDTFEITAGVRVSRLEQEIGNVNSETKDTPVSPKVVLSWRPNDNFMGYASYTTGFRPGNANQPLVFFINENETILQRAIDTGDTALAADAQFEVTRGRSRLTFDGDEVKSYELGAKATLWDGRMQLVAAVYRLDWDDMIQFFTDPEPSRTRGTRFTYNANAGSAKSEGFEMELTALLTDRLTLRVAGDVNSSELLSSGGAGIKGNDLVLAPDYSASVMLDYSWPMTDALEVSFHVDQGWVGSQFTDSENTPRIELPSYHMSNVRISVRDAAEDQWRVTLYARNLTNEEILRQVQTSVFDPDLLLQYYEKPRQVGLEFRWNF